MTPLDRFFAYAREREAIRVRRERGDPWPWTADPILQRYSFCNIFREDDRVTRWVREHVRDAVPPHLVLLAVVVFRWFNRVSTGEALFCQEDVEGGTAFTRFAQTGHWGVLDHAARTYMPRGPWVTGSYMVPTRQGLGYDKLRGVADLCALFWAKDAHVRVATLHETMRWDRLTRLLQQYPGQFSLEDVWEWLRQHLFQGDFNAYEVVTDLRWTPLLERAPDIGTWANAGPGAVRGLNRLRDRPLKMVPPKAQTLAEMVDVLQASRSVYWPRTLEGVATRSWEMRECEHTLCEWDKFERIRLNEGRVKRLYRPPVVGRQTKCD